MDGSALDTLAAPGVRRWRFGVPERHVPSAQRYVRPPRREALGALPDAATPFDRAAVDFGTSARGCRLRVPLAAGEDLYGFGLQLKSLRQTGKKRALRVNSDPIADTGDSHAPAPLYFSTAGYGILVDTARYAVFHTGANRTLHDRAPSGPGALAPTDAPRLDETELYGAAGTAGHVLVDVPAARGVDVHVFAGPTLLDAVRRYVLFCGGGCLPPEWGLGVWYRACASADADGVLRLADELRAKRIPCDVLGLEPGWQTRSYSCSFRWNREKFPDPPAMVKSLRAKDYRVNLWEHAFIHPESPLHEPLKPYAGEYEVWGGLVPDLSLPGAAKVFSDHHAAEYVDLGVDSFKLDECDNSDFTAGPWSFPESSRFPSGMDGEQMHSLFGMLYQDAVERACRQRGARTYGSVRNAHAFAPPMPFVLYSDLYDARDFIRGVAGCGFSGMLWTPELRHAKSPEDYLRRLQAMVLSPQMLLNIWSMPHPPWRQLDREKNRAGELYPEAEQKALEDATRELLELRMRFVPYLLAAFGDYHCHGTPPFRALAMEYPEDPRLRDVDNAWLAGPDLLAAPFVAGMSGHTLPLPAGTWRDFYTGEPLAGEAALRPDTATLPILVRDGATIPLAEPRTHWRRDVKHRLTLHVYGGHPRPARLYADDGRSLSHEGNPPVAGTVDAEGRLDPALTDRYEIVGVRRLG